MKTNTESPVAAGQYNKSQRFMGKWVLSEPCERGEYYKLCNAEVHNFYFIKHLNNKFIILS